MTESSDPSRATPLDKAQTVKASSNKDQQSRSRFRTYRLGMIAMIGAVLILVAVLSLKDVAPREPVGVRLKRAQTALARADYARTDELASEIVMSDPQAWDAWLILGESATKQGRLEQALSCYERIPIDEPGVGVRARHASASLLQFGLRLTDAEVGYRQLLEVAPQNVVVLDDLASLLELEGRRWESVPLLLRLLHSDEFVIDHLVRLGHVEHLAVTDKGRQQQLLDNNDPAGWLGLGRLAVGNNFPEQARELLSRIVRERPDLIEAQAQLGLFLAEQGTESDAEQGSDEFLTWNARLPQTAEQHPLTWFARGLYAEKNGQLKAAIRCYAESVQRAPEFRRPLFRLGRLLVQDGDNQRATPFLERAEQLAALTSLVDRIHRAGPHRDGVREAAERTERLGRLSEAWAWCSVALVSSPQADWASEMKTRIGPLLHQEDAKRDDAQTIARMNPLTGFRIDEYPLPEFRLKKSTTPSTPEVTNLAGDDASRSDIRFHDVAADVGLDFQYDNGNDPSTDLNPLYEFTGGGVAVLDYDRDGWPDLFLNQGGPWPSTLDTDKPGQLFRNVVGTRFENVSFSATLEPPGFGQGVAAGDVNNDGFPDVYVANIGQNRLFLNNGDGTFRDVTETTIPADERWTASCVIADLNGDSTPDLYDVNYLAGETLFTEVCREEGHVRSCSPTLFDGQQDRLLLNLGDDRFRDATSESGIVVPHGDGLGVVAADFDGSGRLSLFIANDGRANFFFLNEGTTDTGEPQFLEQARLRGLAFNGDGGAQACMGVAADDFDNNGLIDLYVTNFHNEWNTLYLHEPGSLFSDASHQSGLAGPSQRKLGFGTQSIDADLDGRRDLIVVNGHVDDFSWQSIEHRMEPQFYHQSAPGKFDLLSANKVGPWFDQPALGRAVARLDWNRDGLEDFVVVNLETPVALLENRTQTHGESLTIQLCGTTSSRDAVGATVTVESVNQTKTEGDDSKKTTTIRQRVAGDGYMAGNECTLTFGTPSGQLPVRVHVLWPSGEKKTYHLLNASKNLIVTETGMMATSVWLDRQVIGKIPER